MPIPDFQSTMLPMLEFLADGVDGVINEDKLGLDVIYVQAKRWEGNVN
jgi:restriction endonuclease Mrr